MEVQELGSVRVLGQLPAELSLAILEAAATQFIHSDRSAVVQLAQTARFVYKLMSPVLYHTVVVTEGNSERIKELFVNAEALSHIHTLHMPLYNWDMSNQSAMSLTGVRVLGGFVQQIRSTLKLLPPPVMGQIARLHVWADNISTLADHPLPNITHISLWLSGLEPGFLNFVPNWLDQAPRLTHLVLELVDHAECQRNVTPTGFAEEIRHLLQSQRGFGIERLVIRLVGHKLMNTEYRTTLAQVDQTARRIWLWQDEREIRDAAEDMRVATSDVLHGRDYWTEGQPVVDL